MAADPHGDTIGRVTVVGAILKTLKAVYAAIVAALSGLVAVLVGDANLGDVTDAQWLTILLAAVLAFGGVYGITNRVS